jgi:hypothetical protein
MDEVSFGPEREPRLPPGRWRALTAGAAGAIAAGAAVTVIVAGQQHSSDPPRQAVPPAALPAATAGWLPVTCTPVHPTAPSLAGMPAGMRPGALRVIIDAMPAGHCTIVSPEASAG